VTEILYTVPALVLLAVLLILRRRGYPRNAAMFGAGTAIATCGASDLVIDPQGLASLPPMLVAAAAVYLLWGYHD